MRSKKFSLIVAFILLNILSITFSTLTGLKAGVHQSTIIEGAKHFAPYLIKELADITVPNQHFDIDAGVGTLKVDLKKIHIHVTTVPVDNLQITLSNPNIVSLNINGIKGNGSFDVHLKLSFVEDTLPTTLELKNLVINADIELLSEKSRQLPDRNIPSINAKKLDVDFDFDFDIHTAIIGNLIKLVKGTIKDKIKSLAKDIIQNKLRGDLKDIFSDLMNKQPLQPAIYKDIAIDYSLIDSPIIENNYVIYNSRAQIINSKVAKTLNPPFALVDLNTQLGDLNKKVEAIVTSYVINTGIYTFILSNELQIELSDKDFPAEAPFHLNTKSLDSILPGLKAKYGENKPVTLKIEAVEPVEGVNLNEGEIHAIENANCSFFVEGNTTPAVIFKINVEAIVNVELKENADLKIKLKKVDLRKIELVETQLPDVNPDVTKSLINFAISLSLPIINEMLSKIKVSLPEFLGVKFNDSAIKVRDEFIEVGVTPVFEKPEILLGEFVAKLKSKYLKMTSVENESESLKYLK